VELANSKPIVRLSAIVILIALLDLLLLLLGGPANAARIAPKNPALVLLTEGILIAVGISIQLWLRDKPSYKLFKLLAFIFTLAISLSLGLVLVNLIMLTMHSH
jgi:hypothetical protein